MRVHVAQRFLMRRGGRAARERAKVERLLHQQLLHRSVRPVVVLRARREDHHREDDEEEEVQREALRRLEQLLTQLRMASVQE